MQRLILASGSEWRAKLLKQAGFEFDVMPTDINEETDKQLIKDPQRLVEILAEKKAIACARQLSGEQTILAADTVVVVADEIIGKPSNRDHAREIIKKLSGQTHQVWTGVCYLKRGAFNLINEKRVFSEKSEVTLRSLSNQEIEFFLDTDEWVGKAGGYQIQKTLGTYITRIFGSYSNIIGLPMNRLIQSIQF